MIEQWTGWRFFVRLFETGVFIALLIVLWPLSWWQILAIMVAMIFWTASGWSEGRLLLEEKARIDDAWRRLE
jgi:hypothetical protein